jgi:hypothetical protein
LTTRSLDRLPVALRPYADETLSSWLSRTASVYGCTSQELLNSYRPFRQEPIDVIDLQPSDATLTSLHVLLGTHPAQLDGCTLAGVYPTWIPDWLSRPSPLWNVSERRTVAVAGLSPAVCPFCLRDDIRKGQSQYSRLGWYCATSTICPIHRAPLFSCCPTNLYHEVYRYRVEHRRPDPTVWIATQTSIVYLFGTPEWTKKRVWPWLNLNPCSAAP